MIKVALQWRHEKSVWHCVTVIFEMTELPGTAAVRAEYHHPARHCPEALSSHSVKWSFNLRLIDCWMTVPRVTPAMDG